MENGELKYAPETPKVRRKETAVWVNKDTAEITFETEEDLFNGSKLAGVNKNTGKMTMSKADLEFNLEQHKKILAKKNEQKEQLEKQIKNIDNFIKERKLPDNLTPRLKQLQNEILALENITKRDNLKEQIKPIEEGIKDTEAYIQQRLNTLAQAPKE